MSASAAVRIRAVIKTIPVLAAAGLLFVLLVLSGTGVTVEAATVLETSGIDGNRNGSSSITVHIQQDEWYVGGTAFHLYQVAQLNDDLSFSYVGEFKNKENEGLTRDLLNKFSQPFTDEEAKLTASLWMDSAETLEAAVEKHGIEADQTQTMTNRQVQFTGLKFGLYLIQGETASEGNRTVTYQPMLICIPQNYVFTTAGYHTNDDERVITDWQYDIDSYVKSADPEYTNPDEPDNPNPEEPDQPESPENPGTPETPSSPSGPSTPSADQSENPSGPSVEETPAEEITSTGTSSPGTGDDSHMLVYLIVAAAAAVLLVLYFIIRKRHTNDPKEKTADSNDKADTQE